MINLFKRKLSDNCEWETVSALANELLPGATLYRRLAHHRPHSLPWNRWKTIQDILKENDCVKIQSKNNSNKWWWSLNKQTHNTLPNTKHHRTQELNAFSKVNAFTTQPAMNKITPSCVLTNLISIRSPKYEQCLCQALVKL